ncbi:hypothetical protein ACFY2K_15260 [Kitasatospora sp. NPDC001309]|uniref:hypothetical protein n=1 Tax=unclassified Kitasatospora TaxID=2633591 RepID=UPI0035E0F097
MPDWSGGLAHAIAAAGIVTAALSGAVAPDADAQAQAGPDRYGTATATVQGAQDIRDTQGPTYIPA